MSFLNCVVIKLFVCSNFLFNRRSCLQVQILRIDYVGRIHYKDGDHIVALSSSQFHVDEHTDWIANENNPFHIVLLLCVSFLLLSFVSVLSWEQPITILLFYSN